MAVSLSASGGVGRGGVYDGSGVWGGGAAAAWRSEGGKHVGAVRDMLWITTSAGTGIRWEIDGI